MDLPITEADAILSFSRILREVQAGLTYVVTADGRPVARIIPFDAGREARAAARAKLMEPMDRQPAMNIGPWTRDELYDD